MICLEEDFQVAATVGCHITTVFGWVHQNVALGAKSVIYDCLVKTTIMFK